MELKKQNDILAKYEKIFAKTKSKTLIKMNSKDIITGKTATITYLTPLGENGVLISEI
jgi:hypothetical protein